MKTKKICLASVICMLCALPSYADIASGASSATCDNSTIGATEGSTDLEANWNANSITVNWYNGNTKITTNTCSYDGAVTIPATPTKAGYTFNGWHVRTAAAAPQHCWEIEDEEACFAATELDCAYVFRCGAQTDNCRALDNETECNGTFSMGEGGWCKWGAQGCKREYEYN